MVRNVFGSLIALIGATAVVWSPFRAWYDGRHGRDVRVDDLFGGLDGGRGVEVSLLRSLFLPMACAALIAVVGLLLRSRLLVALAGLVALGFTVLWMVRQGQAAGSLTVDGEGNGLGLGVAGALGGSILLLSAAALMSGRPARRGRHALTGERADETYGGYGAYPVPGPGGYGGPPPAAGPGGGYGAGTGTGAGYGAGAGTGAGYGAGHGRPGERRPGGARDGEPPLPAGYAAGAFQRDPHEPEAYPRDLYAPRPQRAPRGPEARAGARPPYATGTGAGASASGAPTPRVTWPAAPEAEREDKTIEMPPVTDDTPAPSQPPTGHRAPAPDAPDQGRDAGPPPGGPAYDTGDGPSPDEPETAPWPGPAAPAESDTERTLPQPVRREDDETP
ncbi:hypothetical protein H8N01_20430 [Streptomyces sp. AC536]|uniref:hypothetical protein n=1 Tax=Streptomyces buecherae TaxID=2763006 RepID=UPI00164D7B6D|nr:hypothetical protein [Streptomyces buecherae]MBC3984869.1 hypothetical protein [Streptomyces buecherae]QNJ40587.1 hypothetical protein H7H31_12620 [Streptomyces buecherae]